MDDWLGCGGNPVEPVVSAWRAWICSSCPKNKKGGLWYKAKVGAAGIATEFIAAKNSMAINTPYDDQLHGCEICKCILKLKVHVPAKHILAFMEESEANEFRAVNCWITQEKEKHDELYKS